VRLIYGGFCALIISVTSPSHAEEAAQASGRRSSHGIHGAIAGDSATLEGVAILWSPYRASGPALLVPRQW